MSSNSAFSDILMGKITCWLSLDEESSFTRLNTETGLDGTFFNRSLNKKKKK